jgi:hypothetical protein
VVHDCEANAEVSEVEDMSESVYIPMQDVGEEVSIPKDTFWCASLVVDDDST